MNNNFAGIGHRHHNIAGENSFWPSFTDIMMVITMIFLMATSLLVVRNWQLVAELQESIAAEQIAEQTIESTSLENSTLEERLANAEQSNSILRLRLLKKDEELSSAQASNRINQANIAGLVLQNRKLEKSLEETEARLAVANLEIDAATAQFSELSNQISELNRQLAALKQDGDESRTALGRAQTEIASLTASNEGQQQSIETLNREKLLLDHEIVRYNQQLLGLKGDYETVKSKYEELIKPARTARGKHIAEVYYIKQTGDEIIRYRQPGDEGFSQLSLEEVERRLTKLKQEFGEDLYVKIMIPEDSGLTYNEAWDFMRNLLVKFDYYYQE
ncbi:MAG: chromosome segregation ATPase [Planctomycetota bacterium]